MNKKTSIDTPRMNAQTETEKRGGIDKQDYRRNQFGGSFGGPARDMPWEVAEASVRGPEAVVPALHANALYEGKYPLVSALSRPVITEAGMGSGG